ncbi:MAG: hypothetical protein HGJ98_06225 [Desulfosporosinus sp.]|nr:hypothetical protein [Desulfosporosinus sp.]
MIKEIDHFNPTLASQQLQSFEVAIEQEHNQNDKVSLKKYLEIADRHLGYIYLKTYDQLQINQRYNDAFGILHDIIYQYSNDTKDKIVSSVYHGPRVTDPVPDTNLSSYCFACEN